MIPTEPIGSIPRPTELIHGMQAFSIGRISRSELDVLYHSALRNTIERFEATGSPVITDGEQGKESFITYPLQGLEILAGRDPNSVCGWTHSALASINWRAVPL